MKYTNINERLDLDNQMKNVAESYPVNDDDLMFFIRSKNSTKELFVASSGEAHNFGKALYNIASQNNLIRDELILAVRLLESKSKAI